MTQSSQSQLQKALRMIAPLILMLPLLACGLMGQEEVQVDETASTAPAVAPAADPAPAAAAAGGTCSRVASCCRAYAEAMGGTVPTSTCDAYNDVAGMPEAMCASAISGYRSGLTAMSKAVPTECE